MFRQLAPSVGTARAGLAISPASSSSSHGSSTPVNSTFHGSTAPTSSIRFGSVEFTPHSPVSSPAFSALDKGVDLAFGDFRFHATREGMLRFPNSPPAAKSASTTSSSSSDSDSDSSKSSIYQEDDDYHSIESEEPVDYIYDDNTYGTIYPAHVCMAGPGGSRGVDSQTERITINVSQEAWDRAKEAVERSLVLPPGASQEELQAYHYLLSKKTNEITRRMREMEIERERLDERKRIADALSL